MSILRIALLIFCLLEFRTSVWAQAGTKPLKPTDTLPPAELQNKQLDEVHITTHSHKPAAASLQEQELGARDLHLSGGLPLAEGLKAIAGVNSVQTGASIQKPVIRGLSGNRIVIINNGVRLEGQQWGSEHAPEIDPYVAASLRVVKGAAGIRYGPEAMGGVIIAEPASMPQQGTGGSLSTAGFSNGRGGAVSAMLQQALPGLAEGLSLRFQGTLKRSGTLTTPDYVLSNTSVSEQNISATTEYRKAGYRVQLGYSVFNTKLGILSASHVGNLSDLLAAFNAGRPSVTGPFTYALSRPYQQVNHQVIKALVSGPLAGGTAELVVARQENLRQEYDYLPVNGVSKPALQFDLTSHSADFNWKPEARGLLHGNFGFNALTQGNQWQGRLFIPNFRNYGAGVFASGHYNLTEQLVLEAGTRYDYRWQRAYMRNDTAQQPNAPLLTPTHAYQNLTGTAGLLYMPCNGLSYTLNIGTAWRPPAINELYSNGIHQSAASYEVGNPDLKTETIRSLTLSTDYHGPKFSMEAGAYLNYFRNYIWLQPTLTPHQTIRGLFPEFAYTQADVAFIGFDANLEYRFMEGFRLFSKPAVIQAHNRATGQGLVYVPSNRFENGLSYRFGSRGKGQTVQLGAEPAETDESVLKHNSYEISFSCLYVARQNRVPANSDYVAPPPAYWLCALSVSAEFWNSYMLSVSVSNVFNTRYREYIDRFRYFADEPGRGVSLRLSKSFGNARPQS